MYSAFNVMNLSSARICSAVHMTNVTLELITVHRSIILYTALLYF